MISLKDWITSSNTYPERERELTEEIRANAAILMGKISLLLEALAIPGVVVSSGFRPPSVNAKIKNAAKASSHMTGKAVDFADIDGKLKELIRSHPELLRKLGLFMEDPKSTPTWVHLDFATRDDRPSRIFAV